MTIICQVDGRTVNAKCKLIYFQPKKKKNAEKEGRVNAPAHDLLRSPIESRLCKVDFCCCFC